MFDLHGKIEINPKWRENFDGEFGQIRISYSRQEKRVLKRRKQIPVSEWAERFRMLPRDAAQPGPWRNDQVKYLAGIMDASFHKTVEEIIVCAAPQTGKSESVFTCIGYAADRKPGNVLIVFPDENTAKDVSKDRLQPMIQDSKRLSSYRTGYVDNEGSMRIALAHMRIYMAWANSASRLASRPLPYVHLDEEEKYPVTAGKKEASPTDLARKRTRTFRHMRKIWRTSSPTIESGPIWKGLTEEADLRFDYWAKCPECGAYQVMVFDRIKFPEGQRDPKEVEKNKLAKYSCNSCSAMWDDADRDNAVRNGEWREHTKGLSLFAALKTFGPLKIGFHIPAWISPFVSISECAAAFLKGLKDKTKLKDFLNGYAAEPWKIIDQARTEDRILALRDDRPRGIVPSGGVVACLLAGVDTQDDGFYYEIRAFGYGMEFSPWSVREGFVTSLPALQQVLWDDEYRDADSNEYRVRLAIHDAMGHRTAEVYDFCLINRGRIYPAKGEQRLAQPYAWTNLEFYPGTKKQIPGGLKLLRHDTNYYKNELSRRLEVAPGDPGAWMYHAETTVDWARQMTVEGIGESGMWENPGNKPNHAFDCAELTLVAHDMLGVKHWKRPEQKAADMVRKPEKDSEKRSWIQNSGGKWLR